MKKRSELLAEIEAMDSFILTAAQVAPIIGSDPNSLRFQAHERPETLGFPVTVIKRRVKIPRIPFIKYMKGLMGAASEAPE